MKLKSKVKIIDSKTKLDIVEGEVTDIFIPSSIEFIPFIDIKLDNQFDYKINSKIEISDGSRIAKPCCMVGFSGPDVMDGTFNYRFCFGYIQVCEGKP